MPWSSSFCLLFFSTSITLDDRECGSHMHSALFEMLVLSRFLFWDEERPKFGKRICPRSSQCLSFLYLGCKSYYLWTLVYVSYKASVPFACFLWGSCSPVWKCWWDLLNGMNTLAVSLVFLMAVGSSISEFTAFENGMLSTSIIRKFSPLKNVLKTFFLYLRPVFELKSHLPVTFYHNFSLSYELKFHTIFHWTSQLEFWLILSPIQNLLRFGRIKIKQVSSSASMISSNLLKW